MEWGLAMIKMKENINKVKKYNYVKLCIAYLASFFLVLVAQLIFNNVILGIVISVMLFINYVILPVIVIISVAYLLEKQKGDR